MAHFALLNPARPRRKTRKTRRKTTKRRTTRKRATTRRAPVKRRRYARRNPRRITLRSIQSDYLMPALFMGAGAIVADTLYSVVPLPANMRIGTIGMLSRAAVAIGAGVAVGMVAGKKFGTSVALGGLVTQVYGIAKPQIQAMFPNIQMGEFVDWGGDVGYAQQAALPPPAELGYVSPAAVMSPGQSGGMGMYLSEYSQRSYGGGGGGYGGY